MSTAKSWDSYQGMLLAVLGELHPRRCFEWGPGFSTSLIAGFPSVESVTTIEHDPEYVERLKASAWPNVTILYEPDLDRYAQVQGRPPYDFIFIDGRNRARCLRTAKSMLAPGGVVLLHDAQREPYQEAIQTYVYRLYGDEGHTVALTDDPAVAERLRQCLRTVTI